MQHKPNGETPMTRDEIKAKLAAVICKHHYHGLSASDAAAAILDLCGPKTLKWQRNGSHWACGRDGIVIRGIASRFHLTRRNFFDQTFDTLEAAQAAAQAHADAAHWANTPMGDL
jgi:hypothetical protein